MVGEIIRGGTVQFISSVTGYGVTSFIERLVIHEYILFRHMADTEENGTVVRDRDWTGGTESYSLREKDEGMTLTVKTEVPSEHVESFKSRFPEALKVIKDLAEINR